VFDLTSARANPVETASLCGFFSFLTMDSNIIYIPTTDLLNFNPDSIKSIAFFTSDPKRLSIIDYGMIKLTSVDLTY